MPKGLHIGDNDSLKWSGKSRFHTLVLMADYDDAILGLLEPERNPGQGKCLWTFTDRNGEKYQVGPFSKAEVAMEEVVYLIENNQIEIPYETPSSS